MSSLPLTQTVLKSAVIRASLFRRVAPYLSVALAAGIFLFPFVRVLTGTPDEGVYEYSAQMILQGAIPERDFLEFYPPGGFYWLALFFKLFGATLFTARAVLFCEGIAIAVLLFALSRRLGASGVFATAFVLATSIPFMVMNSPHYDANLFALLSFLVFLSAAAKLRFGGSEWSIRLLLVLAGLLSGWVSCILLQKGFLFAVAWMLSIVILHPNRFRLASLVLLGYCCGLGTELSLYAFAGALPQMIYANVLLPLQAYQNANACYYGFPLLRMFLNTHVAGPHGLLLSAVTNVFISLLSIPFLLILVLPALLPVLGYVWRLPVFRRDWLAYWFAAYALWASELNRLDLGHLRDGCWILIVLFFAFCELYAKRSSKILTIAMIVCVVLSASVSAIGQTSASAAIHTRRGTLYAQHRDAALEFLIAHTHPGEDVFVYPYHPIYYFLADVRNPTRISCFLYDRRSNALFREAVRDLDSKKVRYVFWDTVFSGEGFKSVFPAYQPPPPDELIVEPYLESHYRQIAFLNGFRIMERR